MDEMPEDVLKAAADVWATLPKESGGINAIARAILGERKRCAEWCDLYLFPQEIKEAIIGGDKP